MPVVAQNTTKSGFMIGLLSMWHRIGGGRLRG
jgi:hypothetical protein